MTISEEWRIYDPKDARTHPEGESQVEMEFEDGRSITGLYSRDLGIFSHIGGHPIGDLKPLRWRYYDEEDEEQPS